jgi:hypothetical protein
MSRLCIVAGTKSEKIVERILAPCPEEGALDSFTKSQFFGDRHPLASELSITKQLG